MVKKNPFLMNQVEIAKASGLSQQYISRILNGDRQPSLESAEKLEKATGMCRESWLWPARHWSPYIPFSAPNTCVGCANRAGRIEWAIDRSAEYLKGAEDKCLALQECLDAMLHFNGYDDTVAMVVRYLHDDVFTAIAATHTFLEKDVPADKAPLIMALMGTDDVFHYSNTLDIPESPDREMLLKAGMTSILIANSGDYFFGMVTYRGNTAKWSEGALVQVRRWVAIIERILKGGPHR